jgi:hypothetical protein
MAKPSLPIAGGLSAAAILALALGQWAGQNNTPGTTIPPAASTNTNSGAAAILSTPSPTVLGLPENEKGPWYALCKVFSTIDPEDTESTPNHPPRPQAGLETHPPLSLDSERRAEEIKEEVVTEKTNNNGSVQRKYTPSYHSKADLGSCLPADALLPGKLSLSYLIATIQDPLESHLALQFDRNVVAIERAAEANDFVFERYWFPWNGLLNQQQAMREQGASDLQRQRLQEQPGILIFRKFDKVLPPLSQASTGDGSYYSPRLIVFLVGETPTSGINKVAFSKAATYVKQLRDRLSEARCPAIATGSTSECESATSLQVLGPNFSGSFSTLYRALHDLHKINYVSSADIVSPTTTVEKIIGTFKSELQTEGLGTFTGLSPYDSVTENAMVRYLAVLGYGLPEIAYLSEDESSYSPGTETQGSQVRTTLTYPRDLSALRNTWQPTVTAITPADISGEVSKTQLTPFSLHEDASNELDSPSAFATDQAAPDIDQALSSLIAIMRHRHLRVIIVTASNPLDEVYLLQYVHRNAPDIRLATYDQDFLMLRATDYDSIRGTISVTPFPLDSALLFDKINTAQFPNSASEATYIGVRLLLGARPIPSTYNQSEMSLTESPGIYVLGDDGFWPVKEKKPLIPFSPDTLIVPWIWYVLLTTIVAAAIYHLGHYGKIYMPHAPKQELNAAKSFAGRIGLSGSRRSEDLMQDYFLLVGTNQILILLFLVALPSVTVRGSFVGGSDEMFVFVTKWILFIAVLVMTSILASVCLLLSLRIHNSIIRVKRSACPGQKENVGNSDLVAATCYTIATMAIWYLVICHDWANRGHAAFRAIYLLDGLSPLPVAASVLAVWYLFAAMGLRAARSMKGMRVDPLFLASRAGPGYPEWMETLGKAQKILLEEVESFVKLDRKSGYILIVCFFVLFGIQGWPALRGIDIRWFRVWLVFGGVGLLTASIVVQFFRVWSVWYRLRYLLVLLEISPLGSGFERIPPDLASVKVWRSRESRHSRSLQMYTLELLCRITDRSASEVRRVLTPYRDSAEVYVQHLLYRLQWDRDAHLNEHKLLNACFDACMSPAVGGDESWLQQQCERGEPLVIDYAALRYVALIRYVNTQMRWLLSFVLYGYVILLLSLKTYPFQGRHTIGSALTIVFSVLFFFSAIMFVQMDSNSLLSKLEHSTPGKADYFEAAQRLIGVGGIPLIAVLASQFPIIEHFLLGWVKPTVESLH